MEPSDLDLSFENCGNGETPEHYIDYYANKYGLIKRVNFTLDRAVQTINHFKN